jgi:hypothetical protein
MHLPEWFMKWDEEGWRSPIDYTQYINQIHGGCNIVCRSRRNQARLYGVDLSQDVGDWVTIPDSQINLDDFAIPAAA